MRIKLFTQLLLLITMFNLVSCQENSKEDNSNSKAETSILIENFDDNEMGWPEEKLDIHDLTIKDGYYFIHSKDTAFNLSSAGPEDHSFLWGLPEEYKITSSIELMKSKSGEGYAGLRMESATLSYGFYVDWTGRADVVEYNYHNDSTINLVGSEIEFNGSQVVELRIEVAYDEFSYYVNDVHIGDGLFRAGSWEDLRLVTSVLNQISVDYIHFER